MGGNSALDSVSMVVGGLGAHRTALAAVALALAACTSSSGTPSGPATKSDAGKSDASAEGAPVDGATADAAPGDGAAACTSAPYSAIPDATGADTPLPDIGATWKVGVKVVDVTPTAAELATGAVFMGAYGIGPVRGAAAGVHDPVYARTMVVLSGTTALSMTIMDMPGASNRILGPIADAASAKTHIPRHAVFVGSTHSHSSPDLQGLWGGVPDAYKKRLIGLVTSSIVDAFDSAVPADLMVSRGTSKNRNRRGWQNPDGTSLTDKELTVLDAKAKSDGSRIGTLINFAAHPVKLGQDNLCISRDFVGYTVDYVEEQLGAKDKVLYFNGIVGDVSPDGGTATVPDGGAVATVDAKCALAGLLPDILKAELANLAGAFQEAKTFGEIVGADAVAAMAKQTKVTPGIYRDYLAWEQPVTNVGFKALAKVKNATNGGTYLDYDALQCGNDLAIDTQASYVRFGSELQMVVFPGESLSRTGLAVKDAFAFDGGTAGFAGMKAPFRLWLGLTTDSLGYFVRSDEWNVKDSMGKYVHNGGYEESVSCDQGTGDHAVKILEAAITRDPQRP